MNPKKGGRGGVSARGDAPPGAYAAKHMKNALNEAIA